ncbi:MAG: RNA-binding S4 domain-containing protein [Roseobacter sp.]
MNSETQKLRLDKWLWHARFFKTRSLAATLVAAGDVRVNGTRVTKRSHQVQQGDVLTFAQGRLIRVVRVEALGTRRGPAPEAQTLYADLTPVETEKNDTCSQTPKFEGKGRPTKRDRRRLDLSRARSLE